MSEHKNLAALRNNAVKLGHTETLLDIIATYHETLEEIDNGNYGGDAFKDMAEESLAKGRKLTERLTQ